MAHEKRPIHANSVHCTYKKGIAECSLLRKICNAFFSFSVVMICVTSQRISYRYGSKRLEPTP